MELEKRDNEREATSGGPRSSYGKMHELWDNMSCVGLAVLDMPRSPTPQKKLTKLVATFSTFS